MARPERYDGALVISERLYKALLTAYPREFRSEYGPQMAQAFRDLCQEELRRSGMFGFGKLWVRTILDLATTALVERNSDHASGKEAVLKDYKLAGIGFALLLAPLFFVSASLLKYGLGIGLLFDPLEAFLSVAQRRDVFNLITPFVFLGGLVLSLALNTYAVLRLNISREDGAVVSTVRLRMKFINITIAAMSSLLLVTLVGYAFLENFTYR
jgi:hypothetical protein